MQAGEATNRDAARYHLLTYHCFCQQDKLGWPGLQKHLFTWPFWASLKCWEHIQFPHSVFVEAVSLWFSPALQMATRPGQDLGR